MNNVNCLLISNTIDYSTDFIALELEKRNINYLRINRDQFSNYNILYDLEKNNMYIDIENEEYCISNEYLRSVYFRAPVFLRSSKKYDLLEQLYRSQWSAFLRNLIIFDAKVIWINHPVYTYQAENKLYQLKVAKEIGFDVPETLLSNFVPKNISDDNVYVVKSLDTALFYQDDLEMFTYTSVITGKELISANLIAAPVIIQNYLSNKIDIRVTIVGDYIFAVDITKKGNQIEGDWRKNTKEDLLYRKIILPKEIVDKIKAIMQKLNLNFGGMDLAKVNNNYYFIEVNPTGEWGWLVSTADIPINKAIVSTMLEGKKQ